MDPKIRRARFIFCAVVLFALPDGGPHDISRTIPHDDSPFHPSLALTARLPSGKSRRILDGGGSEREGRAESGRAETYGARAQGRGAQERAAHRGRLRGDTLGGRERTLALFGDAR